MGKNDDDTIHRALAASQAPRLNVAQPMNDLQTLAWLAAMVYPHVQPFENFSSAKTAVDEAVEIFAQAAAVVSSGELTAKVRQVIADRQADQGNPSTAQN
jgi:hypothetical protein